MDVIADMIQAASRLKVLREETCKALMQIPLVLARTGSTIETFSASVELQKCSSNLYIAILKTLEHILRYYRGRSTSPSYLPPPVVVSNIDEP